MTSGARTRTPVSLREIGDPERVALHLATSAPSMQGDAFRRRRLRAPPLPAVAQHFHGLTARLLAAAGEPGHRAERLQHLLHLYELLQQAIYLFDRRSTALRDAFAAAPVDDVLLAPLVGRHRVDDGFDPRNLLVVRLVCGQRLELAHAGQHPHDLLDGTHLPDRLELIAEVLERELVR